jgi:hypothetical protein
MLDKLMQQWHKGPCHALRLWPGAAPLAWQPSSSPSPRPRGGPGLAHRLCHVHGALRCGRLRGGVMPPIGLARALPRVSTLRSLTKGLMMSQQAIPAQQPHAQQLHGQEPHA